MNELFDRLKRETSSLNQRTKFGVVFLLAVLAFDIISRTGLAARGAVRRLNDARAEVEFASEVSFKLWEERKLNAFEAASTYEKLWWTGETPGIIAASIQAELDALSRQHDAQRNRVTVSQEPIAYGSAQALSVSTRINFDSSADFARWFAAFDDSLPAYLIERVELSFDATNKVYAQIDAFAVLSLGNASSDATLSKEEYGPAFSAGSSSSEAQL